MNPGDLSWEPLKALGDVEIFPRTTADDFDERTKDAEIIITNKVPFDDTRMAALPRLKYIGVLATGYNIIDTEAAHKRGITVCNVPAYSADSVAQITFALILAITNRVEHYTEENRKGRWSGNKDFCYWDTPLTELSGKTIGIVGLGNNGQRVARIARFFGMDVFALTSKNSVDLPEGVQKTTLDGLLSTSDILSLHCPLTDDTREMINASTLAKMKEGAILINTSRGPLVNEKDVADALLSGHLGAYGADVMCQEPPSADNPLFSAPNAYITPHIAWATKEARQRLLDVSVANVKAFLDGEPVNMV